MRTNIAAGRALKPSRLMIVISFSIFCDCPAVPRRAGRVSQWRTLVLIDGGAFSFTAWVDSAKLETTCGDRGAFSFTAWVNSGKLETTCGDRGAFSFNACVNSWSLETIRGAFV